MKKTSVMKNILTVGLTAALLTACGASKAGVMRNESTSEAPAAVAEAYDTSAAGYDGGVVLSNGASPAFQEEMAKEASYDYAEAAAEEPAGEGGYEQNTVTKAPVTERKLIKTVDIAAETEEFDTLVPGLQKQVEALGGYIESNQVYEIGSYYVDDHMEKQRCANMTARVPKEKLDGFLEQVGEQTNVTSRSETVEDVTLQYVDLESHKKALLTEQERLLELLAQAESVEDIIAIEGRLSEVRYQLESMESQLRTYDNQVEYSTVYLSITEVVELTPVPVRQQTTWERIGDGFMSSLKNIGKGFREFFVWFVTALPYLVLLAAAILLITVFTILGVKRGAAKRKKRAEAYRQRQQEYMRQMQAQGMSPVQAAAHMQNMTAQVRQPAVQQGQTVQNAAPAPMTQQGGTNE